MELTTWKETAAEAKNRAIDAVQGELTLTKLDFFLIGAVCFLAGICIGMIAAPFTHGISLFSHNGNHNTGNGCHNGSENGNSDSHNC